MAKYIKKKITMCINNVEKGGAEKQFLYIYDYLKDHYEVNIILINKKGIKNLDKNIKKKITVGFINYFFFVLNKKPDVVLFFLQHESTMLLVHLQRYLEFQKYLHISYCQNTSY